MSAKILTTAFLAIRSTIPGELAPDADAAVAVVGRAAAGRLRYAASIRILGVGFRAYVAAVDLLQALQRIVGEGAGNDAILALLFEVAVVVVLKGGNLVTRVRTCSDPGQLMRIVVLVEISRPASRFAYAPVVELIVAAVLDQRGLDPTLFLGHQQHLATASCFDQYQVDARLGHQRFSSLGCL